MPWQVGPWCVPLPEGTRICHLRTNMGLDWGQNVVPVLPDLGALPTDILVSDAATCSCRRNPSSLRRTCCCALCEDAIVGQSRLLGIGCSPQGMC